MATRNGYQIEELTTDDTNSWLERLSEMILVNEPDDVVDRKKVAILLSNIGPKGYNLLKAWCGTDLPNTKSFAVLNKLLRDHLCPKPPKTSERYKFYQIAQRQGETLGMFLARVREAALYCEFGDFYDNMIADRFIGGLMNHKTRNALLNTEAALTSVQAFEKATAKEAAETSATMLGSNSVNYVGNKHQSDSRVKWTGGGKRPKKTQSTSTSSSVAVCSKCTLKGHTAQNCYTKCRYCKKQGHIVANCMKKNGTGNRRTHTVDVNDSSVEYQTGSGMYYVEAIARESCNVEGKLSVGELHQLNCTNSSNLDELNINGFNISEKLINSSHLKVNKVNNNLDYNGLGKPMVNVVLNNSSVEMELDTGAAVSCMNKSTFVSLKLKSELRPSSKILNMASGQSVSDVSTARVTVKYRGSEHDLLLYVVDGLFPTLFGREWIRVFFGESWLNKFVGDNIHQLRVRKAEHESFVAEIKTSRVFEPGLGEVQGYEACLDLKIGSRPKFCKARPVPFAVKEKMGDTLDKSERERGS